MKDSAVVLLIEESIGNLYAFEKGLRQGGVHNPVRIVRYASEARCYLNGVGVYEDRKTYPLPAIILLDLHLKPPGAAHQLLVEMRRQPHLKDIPIIALGDSETPDQEIQKAFDCGANAFFVEQNDVSEIVSVIKDLYLLEDVWGMENRHINAPIH